MTSGSCFCQKGRLDTFISSSIVVVFPLLLNLFTFTFTPSIRLTCFLHPACAQECSYCELILKTRKLGSLGLKLQTSGWNTLASLCENPIALRYVRIKNVILILIMWLCFICLNACMSVHSSPCVWAREWTQLSEIMFKRGKRGWDDEGAFCLTGKSKTGSRPREEEDRERVMEAETRWSLNSLHYTVCTAGVDQDRRGVR